MAYEKAPEGALWEILDPGGFEIKVRMSLHLLLNF